ncbi:MAG: hypothetical protein QOE19_3823 [Actinomycetota bacterium]|jgi:hypothetical protein|nr:hypothetical protein [Actinomycetota bacterium]MDQ1664543.1 hypothetical protein [Actinomycetota bacterium]
MDARSGYCRRMRSRLPVVLVLPLALTFAIAGCGSSSSTTAGAAPSTTPAPASGATGAAVEIVRTGGVAGVRDTVTVDADGSARVTTKEGRSRGCQPPRKALDRLNAIDLAAVAAAPTAAPQLADGFNYAVQVGGERASAGEGDKDSRRADLVDAAAAVLTSCLEGQSGSAGY